MEYMAYHWRKALIHRQERDLGLEQLDERGCSNKGGLKSEAPV